MIGPLADAILALDTRSAVRFRQVVASMLLGAPVLAASKAVDVAIQSSAPRSIAAGFPILRRFLDDTSFWFVLFVFVVAVAAACPFAERLTRASGRIPAESIGEYLAVHASFALLGAAYLLLALANKGTFFVAMNESSAHSHGAIRDIFVAAQALEGLVHLAAILTGGYVSVCCLVAWRVCPRTPVWLTACTCVSLLLLALVSDLTARAFSLLPQAALSDSIAAIGAGAAVALVGYSAKYGWITLASRTWKREQAAIAAAAHQIYGNRCKTGGPGDARSDWERAESMLFGQ